MLELRAVNATKANIYAKGAVWGQLDYGQLKVTDFNPDDNITAQVSGAESKRPTSEPGVTIYTGKNIHFRFTGNRYIKFSIVGSGIDITAVGVRPGDAGRRPRVVRRRRLRPRQRQVAARAADGEADPVRNPAAERSVVSAPAPNILVVEDEGSIASFVSLYLKNAGYGVRTAATGSEALSQVAAQMPGLIVLDLMLPDIDGIEVCKRIRQSSDVPILMLTARDEDVDKIIGLEVGADDYLTKPFNPRELVARVKSILRRATPERRERETEQIVHGDLRVDSGRREVRVGEEEIQLAPKEFDLLWELLDHRGLVLTRDQLLERVWGYTFAGDTRTVDVHVRQLRRKLGEASPIVTVWGVGYKVSPAKDARKETTKT